jgi:hypothetical protein
MRDRISHFIERIRAVSEEFPDLVATVTARHMSAGSVVRVLLQPAEKMRDDPRAAAVCIKHGFPRSVVGMEFDSGEKRFRVVDVKPRAPKYPFVCMDLSTGQMYKFGPRSLKILLGGDRAINRAANMDALMSTISSEGSAL